MKLQSDIGYFPSVYLICPSKSGCVPSNCPITNAHAHAIYAPMHARDRANAKFLRNRTRGKPGNEAGMWLTVLRS